MKIETYIYLEDKKKFVPIDDIEKIKTFVATKEDFMEQGFTNLEGTITFDHEEKGKIEDFENPDSIEELWHYYTNIFEKYVEEGYGKIYYPSVPLEIQLEKRSDHEVMLSLDNQTLIAEYKELVRHFIESGREFIRFLENITPQVDHSGFTNQLNDLEKTC
ncbi:hypothetical protein V7274_09120 [Bacillus pumilus]|uniref:hypothetical protein n=1 Tax=Bacillus pumilus TaxID=1408 RepID=UPI0007EED033|nr:hypothetical protein [Bacillus pumilus]MBU8573892.1 hypothetical protein [Bacillus pumilus]MCY7575608.1 hypothetical protein [Bacillus pumilus]MDX5484566.1 hypothetical protein [Bacillus pumilus]OBS85834.1 hypothetical protein BAY68_03060 [Bacillus pumilus]PRS67757.1 hypothetical protein C6X98_06825 [Bacillus pumilus]